MKYEHKTVLGHVRMRERRDNETHEEYMCVHGGDLFVVDDPVPPNGDGWELVTTSFAPGKIGPLFVAREWRREFQDQQPAGHIEMPDKEIVRDWIRMSHNKAEEAARAKQKAIWQSQLDDAAAEYIAKKLKEM